MFNQTRSINYQLSNLRYIQEGWTVRPSTPIDYDLENLDEEEFNLVARDSVDSTEEKVKYFSHFLFYFNFYSLLFFYNLLKKKLILGVKNLIRLI